jgi:hypothetical protein
MPTTDGLTWQRCGLFRPCDEPDEHEPHDYGTRGLRYCPGTHEAVDYWHCPDERTHHRRHVWRPDGEVRRSMCTGWRLTTYAPRATQTTIRATPINGNRSPAYRPDY